MTIVVTTGLTTQQNYGSLQDEIADWLARDDLDTQIRRFVYMAESDICKDLFVRGMEKEVSFSVSSGVNTLPTDFRSARRLHVDVTGDNRELDYLPPEVFHRSQVAILAGNPSAYTIEGGSIRFAPVPGTAVTVKMQYIGAYNRLENENDSNSLLDKHFDLWLYCALYHGFSYLRDNEEGLKYKQLYDEYVDKINRNSNRERFHGNSLKRFGGFSP